MKIIIISIALLGITSNFAGNVDIKIPNPTIKVFYPKGVQVLIPAADGISRITFSGHVGMQNSEEYSFSGDATIPEMGNFVIADNNISINKGETIHYTIIVYYNTPEHEFSKYGRFDVEQYENANRIGDCYTKGTETIKPLSTKGFEVSYPQHPDINLFAFYGKLNSPLTDVTDADWSQIIGNPTKPEDFVYRNIDTVLKPNDILHYWITIKCGNISHRHENQYPQIPVALASSIPQTVSTTTLSPSISTECFDRNELRFINISPGFRLLYSKKSSIITGMMVNGEAYYNPKLENGALVYEDDQSQIPPGAKVHIVIYFTCDNKTAHEEIDLEAGRYEEHYLQGHSLKT